MSIPFLGTDFVQQSIDEIIKDDPCMCAEYLKYLRSYPKGFDGEFHSEEWVQDHYEDQYWLENFTTETYGFGWSGSQFDAIRVEEYDEEYIYFSEGHYRRFSHLPHILYHGTSSKLLNRIHNEGLLSEGILKNEKESSELVYLTFNRSKAVSVYADKSTEKFGGEPVCLLICTLMDDLYPSIDCKNSTYPFEEWVTDFIDPEIIF